jgi:hypothetical protein
MRCDIFRRGWLGAWNQKNFFETVCIPVECLRGEQRSILVSFSLSNPQSHFLYPGTLNSPELTLTSQQEIMGVTTTSTTSPTRTVSIKNSVVSYASNITKASDITKNRRLIFAPVIAKVVGTVLSRDEYTAEEKENCWWAADEKSNSRRHSRRLINTVRERGQPFIKMIDDSFKAAQRLSMTLGDKEVDDLLQDPTDYTDKLEAWSLNGQGRRGLEKHISVFLKCERTALVREIQEMVIATERMGGSGEVIADICAEYSLGNRIYARWVGDADYSAAYFF